MNKLKKVCETIGKDSNPAYAVVAIAAAKGVLRPLFTMMDKKESPETKKFTAIREGLTEVIAIPTYLACGALAAKGAAFFKDPAQAKVAKNNLRFIGVCTAGCLVIPWLCYKLIKPLTAKMFEEKSPQPTQKLDVTSPATLPDLNRQIPFNARKNVFNSQGLPVVYIYH